MAIYANSIMLREFATDLYFAFYKAIFNPKIFENYEELEEIDLLHSKLTGIEPLKIKIKKQDNRMIYQLLQILTICNSTD